MAPACRLPGSSRSTASTARVHARSVAGTHQARMPGSVRREYEPGHGPPAAPPPAPPRGQARDQLQPPAAFRVPASRAQLRHPGPATVGDLDPDHAVPGRDRDRDRLPGEHPSRCAGRCCRTARSPAGPRHPRTGAPGRAPRRRKRGRPAPAPPAPQASRSPGPPPQSSAQPPFPARTDPGKCPGRRADAHGDARSTRRRASSRDTPPRGRPWPSVETPTVHTDRHNCAHRPS